MCVRSYLEEKPGLTLSDDVVKQARSMLWGGWEGNWLAYNYAHDVRLPGSSKAPLPFFMYPQAENAQGRMDSLDPDNFKYRMTARETYLALLFRRHVDDRCRRLGAFLLHVDDRRR